MQGLKALVIFLGVLILLGVGVLIYGIASKFGALSDKTAAPATETGVNGATPAQEGFGEVEVPLPPGARITAIHRDGSRLLAYFSLERAGEGVAIFDMATGREIGTVLFRPKGLK